MLYNFTILAQVKSACWQCDFCCVL